MKLKVVHKPDVMKIKHGKEIAYYKQVLPPHDISYSNISGVFEAWLYEYNEPNTFFYCQEMVTDLYSMNDYYIVEDVPENVVNAPILFMLRVSQEIELMNDD